MITDAQRRHLHTQAEHAMDEEAADTLMNYLPPVGWQDVATRTDVDNARTKVESEIDKVRTHLESEIDKVRTKIDTVRTHLEAKITEVNAKIDTTAAALDAKIETTTAQIRAELATQISESHQQVIRAYYIGTAGIVIGMSTVPQIAERIFGG